MWVGLEAAILLNYVFKYAFRISVSLYVAWRDFLKIKIVRSGELFCLIIELFEYLYHNNIIYSALWLC